MSRLYRHNAPITLESGEVLPALDIVYDTFGELNEAKDNVVWVCHALTANSDVADWWPHTVEEGRFLDPTRYFVVCANFLGSHYGTTGPLSVNPATGEKWYGDFPKVTVRDMAECHRRLAEHLGIKRVKLLIGSSIGGFQCLEMSLANPDLAENLVLIATGATTTPWISAFNESQRWILENDPTFGERRDDAGMRGMAAARAIGLLTYRGSLGYNLTQQNKEPNPTVHRASTYQQYQGEKLCRRYNAYSYVAILDAFDTHDVGRERGGLEAALGRITAQTVVVGITSDIIFTPAEMRLLTERIPAARYYEIDSPFGHDGFLVEHEQLNSIIYPFINN